MTRHISTWIKLVLLHLIIFTRSGNYCWLSAGKIVHMFKAIFGKGQGTNSPVSRSKMLHIFWTIATQISTCTAFFAMLWHIGTSDLWWSSKNCYTNISNEIGSWQGKTIKWHNYKWFSNTFFSLWFAIMTKLCKFVKNNFPMNTNWNWLSGTCHHNSWY